MVYVTVSCHTLIADSSDMARATTNSVFQIGAGTILYSDVSCIGNESDILNCSLSVRENECNHFQETGVDCLGRQTCMCVVCGCRRWGERGGRGGAGDRERVVIIICTLLVGATVGFETLFQDNNNGHPLTIREGQSLQLCVAVVSGSLPYEELFTISPIRRFDFSRRKKRGNLPASMLYLSIGRLR